MAALDGPPDGPPEASPREPVEPAPPAAGSPPEAAPGPAARAAVTRRRIAIGLYVVVTAVCFLTVSRDRLHSHTPANHFALLAEAWLHGRLDLGGPPPPYTGNNDFAFHEGKHFV